MSQNTLQTYLQNQITSITLNIEHIQKDISLLHNQFEQKIFTTKRELNNRDDSTQIQIEQFKQQFDNTIKVLEQKMLHIDENKMDQNEAYQMMESNRKNIQQDIDLLKNEMAYQKQYFDDQINEKIRHLQISNLTEQVHQIKNQLQQYYQEEQRQLNEHQILTKSLLNANTKAFFQEIERIVQQINSIKIEINDQQQLFIKKPELDTKINQIHLQFELKSDLIEVQNALNTQQIDIAQRFQEFKDEVRTVLELQGNEFYQLINKKANHTEIMSILQNKIDMDILVQHTQDKVPLKDFHQHMSLIENIAVDLGKKQDAITFVEYKDANNLQIAEIQKDLQKKLSKRDFKDILEKKANHEDVSKAFKEIQSILLTKFSYEEFNKFQQNQNTLNEQLCSQNIIGKWLFKGNFLSPGSLIPWNIQAINTLTENFLWDKDKPNIIVVAPGIYEITFGFFAKRKPKIDIMVNGETIINAVNNSSYVVHHSSGKLKDTKNSVTGLTMIDFISLSSRAKINIAYQGDLGEGFLSLRKV
ncbi:unnamed protein product [Paramecium primaurelia]|uniref:C1q domain-containing protein n=1 Tax=Paramecium primaurelia TaxID=5886 RepID=A0A8S1MET8_PARPR|nr:unnamed protein product [Paramecium primaurelia]